MPTLVNVGMSGSDAKMVGKLGGATTVVATHGDRALGLGHPHRPHTIEAGPDTRPNPPPPQTAAVPHLRVPRHPQGPQPRGS